MGNCKDELDAYNVYVAVSLLLTLGVVLYSSSHGGFLSDPERGVKFYHTAGVIKILIGILLLTVLHPGDCAGFVGGYGFLVIIIGAVWIRRGRALAGAAGTIIQIAQVAIPSASSKDSTENGKQGGIV